MIDDLIFPVLSLVLTVICVFLFGSICTLKEQLKRQRTQHAWHKRLPAIDTLLEGPEILTDPNLRSL